MKDELSQRAISAMVLLASPVVLAQVSTDGTLGPAVQLQGPTFAITNTLGTQVGGNLFHSFAEFNIAAGEAAVFTSDFSGVTTSVISRVTGGAPSMIDGLLRSEIPGADIFLINAQGITFGPNASLDLPASLHISTANEIQLGECTTDPQCGRFSAGMHSTSMLAVATPVSFGFLDNSVAEIRVEGATLKVAPGAVLSLVGRLGIPSSTPTGPIFTPDLFAGFSYDPSRPPDLLFSTSDTGDTITPGAVQSLVLGSVDAPVIFAAAFDVLGPDPPELFARTNFETDYGGKSPLEDYVYGAPLVRGYADSGLPLQVTVTGFPDLGFQGFHNEAGDYTISVQMRPVDVSPPIDYGLRGIEDATLVAPGGTVNLVGIGGPAVVSLEPGGDATVRDGATLSTLRIFNSAVNAGPDGVIRLRGDQISLDSSLLTVSTEDHRDAGEIDIRANALAVGNTGGGPTAVRPSQIAADSAGSVVPWLPGSAPGKSGEIRIATGITVIDDQSTVSARTVDGEGGGIRITSGELALRNGSRLDATTWGAGNAAEIELNVERLEISSQSQIDASTSSAGDAGPIYVGGLESGQFDPALAQIVAIGEQGSIVSNSLATRGMLWDGQPGSAGSIELLAQEIKLFPGASCCYGGKVSATTYDGEGGTVLIRTEDLVLEGGSRIATRTFGSGGAGDIVIQGGAGPVRTITVDDSRIASSSDSTDDGGITDRIRGDSGHIDIWAEQLKLSGGGSGIYASTGSGNGGDIALRVSDLSLSDGSKLESRTSGSGTAGDITVRGAEGLLARQVNVDNSEVSAVASSIDEGPSGTGGNISIASDTISFVRFSSLNASSADGQSGSVDLVTPFLVVDRSTISTGTGGGERGGGITVHGPGGAAAEVRILSSQLSSRAEGAASAGDISINAYSILLDRADGYFGGSGLSAGAADGAGGDIILQSDHLLIRDSSVGTGTGGSGAAGDIVVSGLAGAAAKSVELLDYGYLNASSAPSNDFTGGQPGAAGNVSVRAERVTLSGFGSAIRASTFDGRGGDILLMADDVMVADRAFLSTETQQSGNAGNIVISGNESLASRTVTFSSGSLTASTNGGSSDTYDEGDAGSLSIWTENLYLDSADIRSTTAEGLGGDIDLHVDTLRAVNGSRITASTFGSGNAGTISVTGLSSPATAVAIFDSQLQASSIGQFSPFRPDLTFGDAGSISVSSESLEMAGYGGIDADTSAGQGGDISISADHLVLRDGGSVSARTSGRGDAGSILIQGTNGPAKTLRISAGVLSTSSSGAIGGGGEPGSAGDIRIQALDVVADNGAQLSARTLDGDGGTIDLGGLTSLVLRNDSTVSASSAGIGTGGEIRISSLGDVLLDGAGLLTNADGQGTAGSIALSAPGHGVRLMNGSTLSVAAAAPYGQAGGISLVARDLTLDASTISAEALQIGALAGNVALVLDGTLRLDYSLISGQSASADFSGGNFSVSRPRVMILRDGSRIVASSASGGGGVARMEAESIVFDGSSSVTATGGLFTIGSLVGDVVELQMPVISDAGAELQTRCSRNQSGTRQSSLTVASAGPSAVVGGCL